MRIVWLLVIETRPRRDRPADVTRSPALIRWAVIGLAVVGIMAVILVRVYGR